MAFPCGKIHLYSLQLYQPGFLGWNYYRRRRRDNLVYTIHCSRAEVGLTICCRFYLPRNVTSTKGGLRGFKPWFTPRQVQIAVTRVIRDDQSKREYE
jgi:hypothetical protein